MVCLLKSLGFLMACFTCWLKKSTYKILLSYSLFSSNTADPTLFYLNWSLIFSYGLTLIAPAKLSSDESLPFADFEETISTLTLSRRTSYWISFSCFSKSIEFWFCTTWFNWSCFCVSNYLGPFLWSTPYTSLLSKRVLAVQFVRIFVFFILSSILQFDPTLES